MTGVEWESAPSAVVESMQRSLAVRGVAGGRCVMVIEGEMVNAPCSEEWGYMCLFLYDGELDCGSMHARIADRNA